MKLKLIFTSLAILIIQSSYAQYNWSVRINSGIATRAQVADGYYFSFDVGIPITRFLQVAPTFSFSSISSDNFMYNRWSNAGLTSTIPREIPNRLETQDLVGSVSLLILVNPFKIFNDRPSKHEFLIGGGYGYTSYIQTSTSYLVNGQNVTLNGFQTKANSGFYPSSLKMIYNYSFKENLFGGIVAGVVGYDGESVLNTGLQFGVRF